MAVPYTLSALVLVTLVSAASAFTFTANRFQSLPRPVLCGRQQCTPPHKCLPFHGTNVCVRFPTPSCAGGGCPVGTHCALIQDRCTSRPCDPKPFCVKKNPCGSCHAPDEFCELQPVPRCRHVIEPRCGDRVCPAGTMCMEIARRCRRGPCRPQLVCMGAERDN